MIHDVAKMSRKRFIFGGTSIWDDLEEWKFLLRKKKVWKLSNFIFAVKSSQNIKHWASRHDELSLGEGRHAKRYDRGNKRDVNGE